MNLPQNNNKKIKMISKLIKNNLINQQNKPSKIQCLSYKMEWKLYIQIKTVPSTTKTQDHKELKN